MIVVESNIDEPVLQEAILGHEVNGLGLCPPVSSTVLEVVKPFGSFMLTTPQSLYADMVLVIADYLYKQ